MESHLVNNYRWGKRNPCISNIWNKVQWTSITCENEKEHIDSYKLSTACYQCKSDFYFTIPFSPTSPVCTCSMYSLIPLNPSSRFTTACRPRVRKSVLEINRQTIYDGSKDSCTVSCCNKRRRPVCHSYYAPTAYWLHFPTVRIKTLSQSTWKL